MRGIMRVEFDAVDREKIKYLSLARVSKLKREIGVRNRRVSDRSDQEIDDQGVRAEYAFAKEHGLPVSTWTTVRGDRGWDFEMFGRTIEIKGTECAHGHLLVPDWQKEHVPEVLVLVILDPDGSGANIVGWTGRTRFFKYMRVGSCGRRDDNLCMAQADLLGMDTFLPQLERHAA